MPNMELIQAVTVGAGGAANITFNSIPQTYTDLLVKLSGRSSRPAQVAEEFILTFNGNTSSYSEKMLRGNGSTVISSSFSGAGIQQLGQTADGATANTFSNYDIYIPNYTSSNNKSISIDGVTENNGTTALQYFEAGLWSNSAAITSITLSAGSYSVMQHSTAYLYGVSSAAVGAKATGGNIISQDSDYYYHIFTSSGTFTPTQSITADYLVVAGGGGGGGNRGGGGGAGGYRNLTSQSLTAQAYTVVVGAGGTGGNVNLSTAATSGSTSTFNTTSASGGGRGGQNSVAPATGGSGGGAGGTTTGNPGLQGAAGNAGSYSPVEGYAGGAAIDGAAGGGGGGSSAVGAAAVNGTHPQSNAGAGTSNSITGSSVTYAEGGNGGGSNVSDVTGVAGTANRGNGGGGAANQNNNNYPGGNGGSGIVIVRYAK